MALNLALELPSDVFQVIKAGESKELLQLSVKKEAWDGDRKLDSFLTLDTNLTSVRIPLLAFDGKLQPVRIHFHDSNCFTQPKMFPTAVSNSIFFAVLCV